MDDYLSKPFTPDDLYQKLFKKLKIVPGLVSTKEEKAKLFDLNYLRTISGDHPEFVREMVQTFVKSVPASLYAIERAVNEADWITVARMAHQIKPSLTLLGIHQLKESALQIEEFSTGTITSTHESQVKQFIQACKKVIAELENELKHL